MKQYAVKIVLVLCMASSCLCNYGNDYGGSGGYGPSYEGGLVPIRPIKPDGPSSQPGRVVQAAVQTRQTVRYVNVDIPIEEREPQIIEVPGNPIPIIMQFKSASSRIRVQQSHTGAGPSQIQETKSEDQPQHLRHEVIKPIIQEVREIVMPYRKIIQEIRPVNEEIQTIVAKRPDSNDDGKESSGGISGSVSNYGGGISGSVSNYGGGIKGAAVGGNVKRSTRYTTNYGRY